VSARDYYAVLGVARDAPEAEIKKAYRKLAMQHHPDRNNGDKAAEEKFKEITAAYEILCDAEKRAHYDRFGDAGPSRGAQGFGPVDLSEALGIFMRDFGGMGGFDAFFGGGERTRRERQRGADIKVVLKLTLADVATGTNRTVKLRTFDRCEACAGSGAKSGTKATTCGTCGGKGEVRRGAQSIFGQFVAVGPCPTCGGQGSVILSPCPKCQGEGLVRAEKTVQIDVPAGVADHHYLTVRGQGVPGPRGAPPGDLVAVLEIAEDPRFERHGDDLIFDLPVSFAQAALGAELTVPTPYGESVLKIQPGTQTGMLYRVKHKGLPHVGSSGKGDLHVRVRVWTPTHLTAEQRKALEALGSVETAPPAEEGAGKKFWEDLRRAFGA